MEQEETKTTAATGVEMPPEAESWVQLHESELTEMMQKQAKAAITEDNLWKADFVGTEESAAAKTWFTAVPEKAAAMESV